MKVRQTLFRKSPNRKKWKMCEPKRPKSLNLRKRSNQVQSVSGYQIINRIGHVQVICKVLKAKLVIHKQKFIWRENGKKNNN